MSHVATRSLFLRYSSGVLTPDERRKFEDHLGECDRCREAWGAASVLLQPQVERSVRLAADPFLPARIRAIAGEDDSRRGALLPAALRWSLTAAAALALGVYLGHAAAPRTPETLDDAALEFSSSLSVSDASADWLSTISGGEGQR